METLVSLCKRRGFIFQSSEIYGGLSSCWDYGPLGVELKKNIKDYWWKAMTRDRDDIEGLDAAILMHPRIWEASGHVENFTDPLVDCKACKRRFRADELNGENCPDCGGELTEPRQFNLMFKTFMGPVEDSASVIYMRPETAQGIYVNYLNVQMPSRQKIPFGIAQIGKAFRNEITPGNFIFRSREFEQMEMQYFVHPSDDEKYFEYWREKRWQWYLDLGVEEKRMRWHKHLEGELAHYAKKAFDIEFEFPFGWKEIEGIHNRTDFDLKRHIEFSGKDMSYLDPFTNERFVPYIIETSAGADRSTLVTLINGYKEEEVKGEKRVVLSIDPKIAPIKVAIFPLVKRDGMPEIAHRIEEDLRKSFKVFYDESAAVGRRYRRMDEAGTPFCVTVDSDTLKDDTVTVRERDSMRQDRVASSQLKQYLSDSIGYFG
ncbi:MAG: glycine--tRNA ligase [candidate division Zixibacteria bacterium CG_4_9_14_3_um_filter_46_8]|nr:MAG: glycine--tRNA ligase [candidate division Zixibacteria bacterium CG_4_9_14_3_um_filter_46_8]